jgi:hypothetical protein
MRSFVTMMILLLFSSGCGTDSMSTPPEGRKPRFDVDPSKVTIPSDATARDLLERQVIEQITARVKPKEQAAVLEAIRDDRRGRAWAVYGDKELSRLFSVLYAIRDARADEEGMRSRRALASSQEANVLVAVVESFPEPSVFAQVTRSTGPHARNVVLIRRSALSPARLATALEAVSESRRMDGDFPREERIVLLRDSGPVAPTVHAARAATIISKLRSGALREVPGHGTLVATEVTLPPEPRR